MGFTAVYIYIYTFTFIHISVQPLLDIFIRETAPIASSLFLGRFWRLKVNGRFHERSGQHEME